MAKQKRSFYARKGLKPVTGYLSPENYTKLSQLAKADDKSKALYVTRLLERHIEELWKNRAEELYHKHKDIQKAY